MTPKPMLTGIHARVVPTPRGLGTGASSCIAAVRFGLSLTRHSFLLRFDDTNKAQANNTVRHRGWRHSGALGGIFFDLSWEKNSPLIRKAGWSSA